MSNLVIVAIPDENERVWKVSSEKVPHLTLLFLGEMDQVSNLEQIVLFVEHAASLMGRFHLSVDRRGELGADQADVLFFKKTRYEYKAVRDFRATLLQDNNIKTAYDSSTQFDGPWNPHLTLGYPAAPAKPDKEDYGFYSVEFNKIAVWTDDFDGPDFPLKDWWDEYEAMDTIPMDVAMSDISHHGVKGMRWGVQKEGPKSGDVQGSAARAVLLDPFIKVAPKVSQSTAVSTVLSFGISPLFSSKQRAELKEADRQIKVEKLDKKWEKQFVNNKKFIDVHNKAADEMDKFLVGHNGKYKDVDFTKPQNAAKQKKYEDEYFKEFDKQLGMATESVYGSSPSGSRKVTYDHDTGLIKVTSQNVKHAAEESAGDILFFYAERDKGKITKVHPLLPSNGTGGEMSKADATHSVDLGSEFILEHFGTKGMKWGVRKEDVAAVGRAAKSAGGAIGKAASAAGRFAGDVGFENRVTDLNKRADLEIAIGNKAHEAFKRTDMPTIRDKPEYQKAKRLPNRLLNPRDPATKAYRKEVKTAYVNRLEEAANSMTNASGTRQYTIRERGWELPASGGALPKSKTHYWEVSSREIQHATGDEFTMTVEVILDDDGFVTDLKDPVAKTMAQTADLGAEFLAHYGVKGQKWGVRHDPKTENKNAGWLDPEGKVLANDAVKAVVWPLVPPLGLFALPAQVRLARAGARGAKAKAIDVNEQRFTKKAQSQKNFVNIHNGASPRINRDIDKINEKYPDISKPAVKKKYDEEIRTSMQAAYRESANSIGNRANTMHLDLNFKDDGMTFSIKAREGAATPTEQVQRVEHAAADDTITFSGKLMRAPTGHIVGLEFDDFKHDKSMAQSDDLSPVLDLGATFVLEHYGVKGMHWGTRRSAPEAVGPTSRSVVPHGTRRKTKIKVEGGENHPAHADAVKVAEARVKLKKSGTSALSNKELRDVANRISLENQVKQLTSSKGRRFVRGEIDASGQGNVSTSRKVGARALKLVV